MHESTVIDYLVDGLFKQMARRFHGQSFVEFCEYLPHKKYQEQIQFLYVVSTNNAADWLFAKTSRLRTGFELALSSRVYFCNMPKQLYLYGHIPMLDLKGTHTTGIPNLERALREANPEVQKLHWFSSGRSFHAYGEGLIPASRWAAFQGSLLLLPSVEEGLQADARWIGHRLKDGFCALRCTNNSGRFKRVPVALRRPSLRVFPGQFKKHYLPP